MASSLETSVKTETNSEPTSDVQESNISGKICGKPVDPKAPKKYKAWDKEEMMMLREGVQRHGVGSWETIRQDPDFHLLKLRTGVQIKDKWRNLVKYRHLTDEEKVAVANRTSKLHRHRSTGKSNSFTFGSGTNGDNLDWSKEPGLARQIHDQAALGIMPNIQSDGQAQPLNSLSAYQKAQQDRLTAEVDLKQAQAAYDHASLQLNSNVAETGMSEIAGNTVIDGLVAAANQAMRNLVLCKHQLNLARDIETRLLKAVQFQGNSQANSSPVTSSPQALPLTITEPLSNGKSGLHINTGNPQTQALQNTSVFQLQRSQSYDASTFPPFFPEEAGLENFAARGTASPFHEVLELAIPGAKPVSVSNSGTRSPRRTNGSLPCSPLSKGRVQAQVRGSMLNRSFNLSDTFCMTEASGDQSFQPNTFFNSFGSYHGNDINLNDGGAACSASSATSTFLADNETSSTPVDFQLPNIDNHSSSTFAAPTSASTNTTPQAHSVNTFFGNSQAFNTAFLGGAVDASFMPSCTEMCTFADASPVMQDGCFPIQMFQAAASKHVDKNDTEAAAGSQFSEASSFGKLAVQMDTQDSLPGLDSDNLLEPMEDVIPSFEPSNSLPFPVMQHQSLAM